MPTVIRGLIRRASLTHILFIGGSGRCGSTVLAHILDRHSRVFFGGELISSWDYFSRNLGRCSCGETTDRCSFWSRVRLRLLSNGGPASDFVRMSRLRFIFDRAHRALPYALFRTGVIKMSDSLRDYLVATKALLQAIRECSSCQFIVDTSKSGSHALLLRLIHGLDPRVIHLVRDSRAVAYSWARKKRDPGRGPNGYMTKKSLLRSLAEWNVMNSSVELARTVGLPFMRLRYEDLVGQPERSIASLATFSGLGKISSDLSSRGTVKLKLNHSIGGNPTRFVTGAVSLRIDNEWRLSMPWHKRRIAELLTAPLMWRYGYFGSKRALY